MALPWPCLHHRAQAAELWASGVPEQELLGCLEDRLLCVLRPLLMRIKKDTCGDRTVLLTNPSRLNLSPAASPGGDRFKLESPAEGPAASPRKYEKPWLSNSSMRNERPQKPFAEVRELRKARARGPALNDINGKPALLHRPGAKRVVKSAQEQRRPVREPVARSASRASARGGEAAGRNQSWREREKQKMEKALRTAQKDMEWIKNRKKRMLHTNLMHEQAMDYIQEKVDQTKEDAPSPGELMRRAGADPQVMSPTSKLGLLSELENQDGWGNDLAGWS